MIQYFNRKINLNALTHAKEEFPNESCGIVVNDEYIPCENIATDKRYNFEINPKLIAKRYIAGDLQAIIHSHADEVGEFEETKYVKDYGHASKDDMIRQAASKVPYGIVHLNIDGNHVKTFYFGDELPVQDLKGRIFIHGIYDCYGLLRDYYKTIFKINLPQFPRQFGWWNKEENSSMLMDYAKEADFFPTQIDEFNKYKHGDAVFFTILSHVVNHCAVYTENGLIIHHLAGRLSCEEPLMVYKNSISCVVRYKEFEI